jgi:carboxyl-terminal processing protease
MKKYGWLLIGVTFALQGCGGGGDDDPPGVGSDETWEEGVFEASSRFDAECAAPRSGGDPDGRPWPDVQGSATDEKNWLRSWTHELYLWYDEVPDIDPATNSVVGYFELLKTSELTPSNEPKDKFHFTYPTDEWLALSESGVVVGYGLQWAVIADTPPREVVVAYTDPGSSATTAGLARGDRVLEIDGVDIDSNTNSGIDTLNAGLAPQSEGETHTFRIRELDGDEREVTLTAGEFETTPVQNVRVLATGSGPVGYVLFNDHIATAEAQLVDAIEQLDAAEVVDLVLDIRYNGGGYLDIASELAYMIAGSRTAGRTFELLEFNDKHPDTNPVTGAALEPIPFASTTQGFSVTSGQPLPTLDLSRVFVLTGPGTCSASESVINSLRGIGVEVVQVGSTTCGKPYGFYPADNCGTTYFSIQFRGVNDEGFGDYADGFSPENSVGTVGVEVPGCSVADDFEHALGDPLEGRLAEALQFRQSEACSVGPSGFARSKPGPATAADGAIVKSPWHENRILRRRR